MWYDPKQNVLVYKHDATTQYVAGNVPEAREKNGFIAIRATLDNLQKITTLGLPVPPVMNTNYSWPGRFKPHTAQRVMTNFLALNPRAFNLSDMRTGKTLASLWASDYIMEDAEKNDKPRVRALIVAPLKTLKRTWEQNIREHFIGKRTCVVLHGSAEKRRSLLAQDADFYIINPDGLSVGATKRQKGWELTGFAHDLYERKDIQIIIGDEFTIFKSATAARHRVASIMFKDRKYLWGMTGTPTPEGPMDAYGQARLVDRAYKETQTAYHARTMQQVTKFKWVVRKGASDMAFKLLSPAVRFRQEDCFDAPIEVVMPIDAELSAEQAKHIKLLKQSLRLKLSKGVVNAPNQGVLRMKLIQIACGAVYDENHDTHLIDAEPRISALMDIIAEAPRKIIVFAPLTGVLHLLQSKVAQKHTSICLSGLTPREADDAILRFQQDDTLKVLIAHPEPISRGLDLTAAATIVWYAPTDKTEVYLQANQRINGPAQTYKQRTVVQIAATATEREIYRRMEANESMQGVILKLAEE